MKIELSLTNAVRFSTDEHTRLHLHTEHASEHQPQVISPEVGPNMYLKKRKKAHEFPYVNSSTPYGSSRNELTAFGFGDKDHRNYATTADLNQAILPPNWTKLTEGLWLSLFVRPDAGETGAQPIQVAGIPGQFGLYQVDAGLVLRLVRNAVAHDLVCPFSFQHSAWHLIDVVWAPGLSDGAAAWYLNGVSSDPNDPPKFDQTLDAVGDRFNLGFDPATNRYWQGALRELQLSVVPAEWQAGEQSFNKSHLDEIIQRRAMTLFGLASESSPVPDFERASIGWIRSGGVLHALSYHHPRANKLGTVIEEERTNLIGNSTPPASSEIADITDAQDQDWVYASEGGVEKLDYLEINNIAPGRYTLWMEQLHPDDPDVEPVTLTATVLVDEESKGVYRVAEDHPGIIEVPTATGEVKLHIDVHGEGQVSHVQLEQGKFDDGVSIAIGPTTPIITHAGAVTRAVETLTWKFNEADIENEQGRLDLEITPQFAGARGEVGTGGTQGDILGISLTQEEIVSIDGKGDSGTLPSDKLWEAGKTRSFHVEWQPGTRLLMEDSLRIVTADDYSGVWTNDTNDNPHFHLGGGGNDNLSDRPIRANCYFKGLVLDDWVPRYHADLHRFMYRQFGVGGFSEEETSDFRKWRRIEGDGLALMGRLGDQLKRQAFADTVDVMLRDWERALGLPALAELDDAERRRLLADLFKSLSAQDAEIEENIGRIVGQAVVVERHVDDVTRMQAPVPNAQTPDGQNVSWVPVTGSNLAYQWQPTVLPGGSVIELAPQLKEILEYYVKIPESYYKQVYLELIRWLLERQEPAHTVGWPVVRAELETSSDNFGKINKGPFNDDELDFDQQGSMTERDCVGLAGCSGTFPQAQFLPSDIDNEERKDRWRDSFSLVQKPTSLFVFTEEQLPIFDYIGNIEIQYDSEVIVGQPRFKVACNGISAADRFVLTDNSKVKMNIARGVELLEADHHFQDDGTNFELGDSTSIAFLHICRFTKLPEIDDNAVIFALETQSNLGFELLIDHNGDLVIYIDGGTTGETTFPTAFKPGQWICALTVLDRSREEARIYTADGQVSGTLNLTGWTVDPDAVFSLGAAKWPTASSSSSSSSTTSEERELTSAACHHLYLAIWQGHAATELTDRLINEIWRGLNPRYGIQYLQTEPSLDAQTSWPVGGPAEITGETDPGTLAAKYSGGQFPFAVLGDVHDPQGDIYESRGYGCTRSVTSLARSSENFYDAVNWTIQNGTVDDTVFVVSPEGLHSACAVAWSGQSGEMATSLTITPGDGKFVVVSCWVRADNDTDQCELFLQDSAADGPAVVATFNAVHRIDSRWQRLVTAFEIRDDTSTTLSAGLKQTGNSVADATWHLWGFQVTDQPILSPYVPNYATDAPATCSGTAFCFDEVDFQGFRESGFVTLRLKPEELFSALAEDSSRALIDIFETDDQNQIIARAHLELRRSPEEGLQLAFTLGFVHPKAPDDWWEHTVVMDPLDDSWNDHRLEHQVAVAFDLQRSVALTGHHLALWVDGELADGYGKPTPIDPIDHFLSLSKVAIGCHYHHVDPTITAPSEQPAPTAVQPCAVIREVELYTRHHPGLFTPNRLEMRERKKADLTE